MFATPLVNMPVFIMFVWSIRSMLRDKTVAGLDTGKSLVAGCHSSGRDRVRSGLLVWQNLNDLSIVIAGGEFAVGQKLLTPFSRMLYAYSSNPNVPYPIIGSRSSNYE